jgi:dihydroorotate dehydrogenase
MVERVVRAVKEASSLPVITKVSPLTTDLISIGKAARTASTDGLSLLNALGGLPGVDIENGGRPLFSGHDLQGSSALVGNAVAPLSMWATAVFSQLFDEPLISGGGVMNAEQALERVFLGADLVGLCAVLYRDGHEVVARMLEDMTDFMTRHGHNSLADFRGQALDHIGVSPFWAYSAEPVASA